VIWKEEFYRKIYSECSLKFFSKISVPVLGPQIIAVTDNNAKTRTESIFKKQKQLILIKLWKGWEIFWWLQCKSEVTIISSNTCIQLYCKVTGVTLGCKSLDSVVCTVCTLCHCNWSFSKPPFLNFLRSTFYFSFNLYKHAG